MGYWSNICIESFCGGGEDRGGNYPCGRNCPSHLCLENGMCPHLGYAETTEREVAQFPKLYLIIWDRLKMGREDIYWKLRWWLWDCLWFNQRKTREFFDSIGSISSAESPALKEYENEQEENAEKFKVWFKGV